MDKKMKRKKIKKMLLLYFIDICTSGKYKGKRRFEVFDYLVRYVLMNCIFFFGLVFLAAFSLANFRQGMFINMTIGVVMATLCILNFALARSAIPQSVPAWITCISYGLMCIALVRSGETYGTNFMFIYMFPLLAIMLLGMRGGIITSVILIAMVAPQMLLPGLSRFEYHTYTTIYAMIAYILLLFITVIIEVTRKTKDRMIHTQNRLMNKLMRKTKAANSMLETVVQERTGELREQTRIAVQASRAKSAFLATMSHEIRTPLNAVIGLSELELQGDLPESSKNNIQQIFFSGSSLLAIINDILDISKIEAGGLELIPVEYKTADLINDTANLNRIRIGSKPISFVLEIEADFPRKLTGDDLRIKQVLNNLLSNAIKYTEEGTVHLSAAWETTGQQGELLLRFSVKDTGQGIRKEDFHKLFSSYNQLESMTNRKVEGTGLGLAITKNLVEMMGGSITVESEYGKGSVFTVEIIQRLADSAGGDFEHIGKSIAEDLRNFRYLPCREEEPSVRSEVPYGKVLVVDDIQVNLLVASGMLELYGLQVDTAESGQQAIDLVKAEHSISGRSYDIIFMDHMMPEMDGIEAVAAIRAWEKELHGNGKSPVPIVALTANVILGMKEMFIEKGFNDFLAKPVNIAKLDEVLVRWLNTR